MVGHHGELHAEWANVSGGHRLSPKAKRESQDAGELTEFLQMVGRINRQVFHAGAPSPWETRERIGSEVVADLLD